MRALFIISLLLLTMKSVRSQQSDFVLMPQATVSYKSSRSVYYKFTQQALFSDNAREFWMSGSDADVGFRINKFFKTELHARWIQFNTSRNILESRALFFHTISYHNSWREIHFSLRNRIQQLVFVEHFNDEYRRPKWYNRLRFTASHRINYYYGVGINTEIFYPLNNPDRRTIDQIRVGTSLERRFNEHWEISVGYQLQQQLARTGNNRFFVASIQTILSL